MRFVGASAAVDACCAACNEGYAQWAAVRVSQCCCSSVRQSVRLSLHLGRQILAMGVLREAADLALSRRDAVLRSVCSMSHSLTLSLPPQFMVAASEVIDGRRMEGAGKSPPYRARFVSSAKSYDHTRADAEQRIFCSMSHSLTLSLSLQFMVATS